jgi:hypothetical protein
MLPVSSPWLTALDSMQEGLSPCRSPLKGLLDEISSQIQEPFWCRQIRNLFSDKLSSNIKKWVLPVVNTGRLGGKPNSPLVNVNHYNTMAWSKFPCSCQYKYDGWDGARMKQYGTNFPELVSFVQTVIT